MDSVSQAAVAYLSGLPDLVSKFGAFTDLANAGVPWIFDSDLIVTLEGTGQAALVLTSSGIMQTPPQLGSQRFERLMVELYVDPQRDVNRNVTVTSAFTLRTVEALFTLVHQVLQRLDPDTQVWGDMVTNACQQLGESQADRVSDGDQMFRKQAFYGVGVVGWLDSVVP